MNPKPFIIASIALATPSFDEDGRLNVEQP